MKSNDDFWVEKIRKGYYVVHAPFGDWYITRTSSNKLNEKWKLHAGENEYNGPRLFHLMTSAVEAIHTETLIEITRLRMSLLRLQADLP